MSCHWSRFYDVSRGYRKIPVAWNGLKSIIANIKKRLKQLPRSSCLSRIPVLLSVWSTLLIFRIFFSSAMIKTRFVWNKAIWTEIAIVMCFWDFGWKKYDEVSNHKGKQLIKLHIKNYMFSLWYLLPNYNYSKMKKSLIIMYLGKMKTRLCHNASFLSE